MKQGKLDETLKKHELWLEGAYGGEKADLSEAELRGAYLMGANLRRANLIGADLSEAYLMGANLRGADLSEADLRRANLTRANLRKADLSGANLSGAKLNRVDLRGTDLKETDLSGADLDFSCLPLWCGSLNAHFDDRQLYQIAYHLVRAGLHSKNASEETKNELSKLIDFANKFHRVEQCGEIKREELSKTQ